MPTWSPRSINLASGAAPRSYTTSRPAKSTARHTTRGRQRLTTTFSPSRSRHFDHAFDSTPSAALPEVLVAVDELDSDPLLPARRPVPDLPSEVTGQVI